MSENKSPKKVLAILSSPRKKGNSTILANHIIKGAESVGAQVESIHLHEMKIAPCNACGSCQKEGSSGCIVNDDMQSLYPKLVSVDAWVLASPVYWFTMSAQLKLFLDRCYAFIGYSKNPFVGKRIAIAMSYGDIDAFRSGCVNALRTFQDSFRYVGADLVGMVYGSGDKPGDIESDKDLMISAEELGKKLVL